jgi:hypothetical protein
MPSGPVRRSKGVGTENELQSFAFDNTLQIKLTTAKNLPGYIQGESIQLTTEVLTSGYAERVMTPLIPASKTTQIDFVSALDICNEAFTQMYKTRPLVIEVFRSGAADVLQTSLGCPNTSVSPTVPFGRIEVHLGLLFAG